MKKICRNCHFLAKEFIEENTGRSLTFSVSTEERKKAENGVINFVRERYCLKCHLGVWDEGVDPGKENRLSIVNEINRKGKCFFFPYDPGMLFKAAEELQRRQRENEQLKRSNLYTQIGLFIVALSLIINAIGSLFKC